MVMMKTEPERRGFERPDPTPRGLADVSVLEKTMFDRHFVT